jgi:hypothetical protein
MIAGIMFVSAAALYWMTVGLCAGTHRQILGSVMVAALNG